MNTSPKSIKFEKTYECLDKTITIFLYTLKNMKKRREHLIRIIALGNSLTVGLETNPNLTSFTTTPYTNLLRNLAQNHITTKDSNLQLVIINKGVCGDLTSDMLERFDKDVVEKKPHYVIIIGGTNDIGWGFDTNLILHNLLRIYDKAEKNRIKPVACTIPSIRGFDDLIPPRLELNTKICIESKRRTIPCIDLFEVLAEPTTHKLLYEYSSDGLHLNAKGYRKIGEVIFHSWLKETLQTYIAKY
jgi:lysophospholipase L1-like esterase